jgi:hypothetical protein
MFDGILYQSVPHQSGSPPFDFVLVLTSFTRFPPFFPPSTAFGFVAYSNLELTNYERTNLLSYC